MRPWRLAGAKDVELRGDNSGKYVRRILPTDRRCDPTMTYVDANVFDAFIKEGNQIPGKMRCITENIIFIYNVPRYVDPNENEM